MLAIFDHRLRLLFLRFGLLDLLKFIAQPSDTSDTSDLSSTCSYAIDVLSGAQEVTLSRLLKRYRTDPIAPTTQFDVGPNGTLLFIVVRDITPDAFLYRQCFALRHRLMGIRGFPPFFAIASMWSSSPHSVDPVAQIWKIFCLGASLCFIYNLLDDTPDIVGVETDPRLFEYRSSKARAQAISLFANAVSTLDGCESFTISELCDRRSVICLMKVNILSHIICFYFLNNVPLRICVLFL